MPKDHWLPIVIALALAPSGAAALADDPCPACLPPQAAPAHGGQRLRLGESRVSLEVVHDPAAGTMTVYAVEPRGAPIPLSAPFVIVEGTPTVEVTLDEVPGKPNEWKATNSAFRSRDLSARLRMRAGGRDEEVGFTQKSAGVPVVPVSWERPVSPGGGALRHGGRLLVLGGGAARFEAVHDTGSGTLILYSVSESDRAAALETAPRISVRTADGIRELTLAAREGPNGIWSISDPVLRVESLEGTVRVTVGGKSVEGSLADPRQEAPRTDPADRGMSKPTRGGRMLYLCGATFEAVHDRLTGTISLYAVRDGAPTMPINGPPTLSLGTSRGGQEIVLTPMDGQPDSWSATSDALKGESVAGDFALKVDGLPCQAPWSSTAAPADPRLVVGDGLAELRMVHEAALGRVTFYRLDLSPKAAALESPVLVVRTDAGSRTYPLVRLEARDAWSVTDPGLRAPTITGTLRVTIANRAHETLLPARAPARAWDESESTLLSFGDGAAQLRVMFDPSVGRLWLDPMGNGSAAAFDEAPIVVVQNLPGSGSKERTLTSEKSAFGGWTIREEGLRGATSIDARIRVRIAGRLYETALRRPAPPAGPESPHDREGR